MAMQSFIFNLLKSVISFGQFYYWIHHSRIRNIAENKSRAVNNINTT